MNTTIRFRLDTHDPSDSDVRALRDVVEAGLSASVSTLADDIEDRAGYSGLASQQVRFERIAATLLGKHRDKSPLGEGYAFFVWDVEMVVKAPSTDGIVDVFRDLSQYIEQCVEHDREGMAWAHTNPVQLW